MYAQQRGDTKDDIWLESGGRFRLVPEGNLNQWPHVVALAFASAVGTMGFNTLPVTLGIFAAEFGFTEDQLGYLAGIGGLAAFMTFASSYFWVHRVSLRSSIRLGTLLLLGSISILFVADSFVWFLGFMFLLNAAGAIVYVTALSALGATSHPTRAFSISIGAQVLVAGALVFSIPGWIYPQYGWPGFVWVFMLPCVVLLGVLPRVPSLQLAQLENAAPQEGYGEVQLFSVWLAVAACGVYFLGLNAVWTFVERIGNEAGLDSSYVGTVIGSGLVIGILGAIVASVVRISVRTAMVIVFALFALLVWTFSGELSAARFAIAVFLLNTVWNFSLPFQWAAVAALGGPRYVSLIPAAIAAGNTVGASAAGVLIVWGGYSPVYAWFLVFIGVSVVMFIRASRGLTLQHV